MGKLKKLFSFGDDRLKKINAMIWTLAALLTILTLLTVAVVVMRLGNLLSTGADFIFIIPKEPEFVMSNDGKKWEDGASMGIFKAEYAEEGGSVTMSSANGEAIFAPGSVVTSDFELRNSGNMAVDYSITLDFGFLKNGQDFGLENSPLEVRLYKKDSNEFIVGGENEWVPVSELGVYNDSGTLGLNSYNIYILEIKWEFESGNDERDTWLGNLTMGDEIDFSLDMGTVAELNPDPNAKGGIIDPTLPMIRVGGGINVLPFVILIVFMVAVAAGLVVGIILRKKEKANREDSDDVSSVTPEAAAAATVAAGAMAEAAEADAEAEEADAEEAPDTEETEEAEPETDAAEPEAEEPENEENQETEE